MRWPIAIAMVVFGCGSRPRPLGNTAPGVAVEQTWGNCPTPVMVVRTVDATGHDADVCRAVNRVLERRREVHELGGAFVLKVGLRLPCILTAHLYVTIDGAPIGMASGGTGTAPDGACIEAAFEGLLLEHLVPIMRSRAP